MIIEIQIKTPDKSIEKNTESIQLVPGIELLLESSIELRGAFETEYILSFTLSFLSGVSTSLIASAIYDHFSQKSKTISIRNKVIKLNKDEIEIRIKEIIETDE